MMELASNPFSLMTTSTPDTYYRAAPVAKVLLKAASTRASEDIAQLLKFITSLPPDTNVYAALIPYLNAQAATSNPRWMSILLVFILFAHISIIVFGTIVLSNHLRKGDYYFFRTQQGLIQLDRTLCECLGGVGYAIVTILDILVQLCIDYYQTPVPGRILIFWCRWPVVNFALWCIMWGCISTHVRGIWDPTFRENGGSSAPLIPKMVVILLNTMFFIFSTVFLLVYPFVGIPSHLLYTQIFNILRDVTGNLLVASQEPNATQLSLSHLQNILLPLLSFPERIDQLAASITKEATFLEVLNGTLIITYIPFVFLTARQLQSCERNQKVLTRGQSSMVVKVDYTSELRNLVVEAILLLVSLCSYQPLFIWMATTRSSEQLVLSKATAMVPELTVTLVASVVAPSVALYRVRATRRWLNQKRTDQREKQMRENGSLENQFHIANAGNNLMAQSSNRLTLIHSDIELLELEKPVFIEKRIL